MYLVDNLVHSLVAVGVSRHNLALALEQNIVNTPGIDGKALNFRIFLKGNLYSCLDFGKKSLGVSNKMTVYLVHSVGEAVKLLGYDFSAVKPANDMPAA